jgi:hypothetical protein
MVFSRVYLTCLLLGALLGLSAAFPASASPENPLDMLRTKGKGIIGNPAQVFTDLFNSLSGVLVNKLNEAEVASYEDRLKRRQEAEEDAEEEEAEQDEDADEDGECPKNKRLAGELVDKIVQVANETKKLMTPERREEEEEGRSLEEIELKLNELDAKIKERLNMSLFGDEKYEETRLYFENEFKGLKSKFMKGVEGLAKDVGEFATKMGGGQVASRAYSEEEAVAGDEKQVISKIDEKISELEESIRNNLNLTVFEHHKFHRSKAAFVKAYKETKFAFLKRMGAIEKEIAEFTEKALSKNAADKKLANRFEESLLYRNEQSLF